MSKVSLLPIIQRNKKVEEMKNSLTGYWNEDRWDLRECPLESSNELKQAKHLKNRWINFGNIKNTWIKTELKFFYYYKLINDEWKPGTVWIRKGTVINNLISFLSKKYPNITSISEVPLEKALIEYRTFLIDKGISTTTENKKINSNQEIIKVKANSYYITNLKQFVEFYQDYYLDCDEFEKDVWDRRKLNIPKDKVNESQYEYKITFKDIKNEYFKSIAKRYCKYMLNINSFSYCGDISQRLKVFFNFISDTYPNVTRLNQITRSHVEDYLSFINNKGLVARTSNSYKGVPAGLFEKAQLLGWDDVPKKRIFFNEDYTKQVKAKPRYIEENILIQLNENLDKLPSDIRIMTIILEECGMRISELCALKINCLIQDNEGDYFLKYYQNKMKKEHIVPISKEVAMVIKEQEKIIINRNNKSDYLFQREDGSSVKQSSFRDELNKLAVNQNITDSNGKVFRFQAHAFRHTVGTRMINNGVPQYIVQKYLGHSSPEMTNVYAQIHDKTMKKAFNEFKENLISNNGDILELDNEIDNEDLQWFKKNINAQTLPNGYCKLPTIAGACPHANACLDCGNFCTSNKFLGEHKKQLEKTNELLEIAKSNNWQRQIETNLRLKNKLETIISSLED
ncbi:tyrosine-type recombinase/integrase [Paraclostridium bifermentans]|nr:site-specific integrase [Paraclostridium bifermentans]